MTWVAVAIGGSALLGAGSAYAGGKQQADASKKGAALQMQQFETLNRQQQPFIQSGYGAMGKLNTLLGIGSRPSNPAPPIGMPTPNGGQQYQPTPGGGVRRIVSSAMGNQQPLGGMRLKQILMLRAMNGDDEAKRVLGAM